MKIKGEFADNSVGKITKSVVSPIYKFMSVEASGGIILLFATVVAMVFANSPWAEGYFSFINTRVAIEVGTFSLEKSYLLLVNDGLMAIFFFLVGLEIKREIIDGELSTPKKASFSIFAAIGGMLFPALIYLFINSGGEYSHAWGVPMATDIAFALGILSLLGKRVPTALKVFLLALAIVDDLGAILVIALFYSSNISAAYLGYAGIALFTLFLLNKAGLRNIVFGLFLGFFTWYFFLKSGVHATIAGVLLAIITPAYPVNRGKFRLDGPLLIEKYIDNLHPWVAFGIMPIFAFFNAGVPLGGLDVVELSQNSVVLGIMFGLVFGNPIGIFTMTYLATKIGIAEKPKEISWPQVVSVACLAGIGFTMSLFIGSLAFPNGSTLDLAKIGILMGSLVAMIVGLSTLVFTLKSGPEAVKAGSKK